MSKKYNRTFHFPFSKGATNDDKIIDSFDKLINVPIVITEKIDGSNTSLEHEGCFARTHSGPPTHPSFDGLKQLHATVKHKIPKGIQLFGEWCYALHSIAYDALPGYFLLFNVRYTENNKWASWEEVEMWANEIEVPTVPVLFKGAINSEDNLQKIIKSFMIEKSECGGIKEGVVARIQNEFDDNDFATCVAKFVRENHVQTSTHWKDQEIIRNKLAINAKLLGH